MAHTWHARPHAGRGLSAARMLLAIALFLVVGVELGVVIGSILGRLVALVLGLSAG